MSDSVSITPPRGAGGSPETSGLSVWLVNQYALRANQPGITRHASLSRFMSSAMGITTTIFASSTHYWNLGDEGDNGLETSAGNEPTFVYVNTAPVVSNGVARVISMLSFSLRVVLRGSITKRAKVRRPDVIVGSSPHPFAAVAAWILAKRYRVPFVLEVRDLWPKSLVELMKFDPRHPLIRLLELMETFLYRNAAVIITLLPGSENHIHQVAPGAGPVVLVPNGLDVSKLPVVAPRMNRNEYVVMYAGAHGVPNSLETLLDAAAILEREPSASRVKFVLVGEGKEKRNLQRRATQLGLTRTVFRDAVPKTDVHALLSSADLLVITWHNTPLYQNGISPNKLFDYMAAGRPVIMAVDTPINPLEQAGAGLTVPPEDPAALAQGILNLSQTSEEERTAMGLRGRTFVEKHHDMKDLALRYGEAIAHSRLS